MSGEEAQGVGPEFKPQYCIQKEKKQNCPLGLKTWLKW
jgi:hypothetical protein